MVYRQQNRKGTSSIESSTAAAVLAVVALAILLPAHLAQAQSLTVPHTFTGGQDGANPHSGLVMDRAGNFYGTTQFGGSGSAGAVFKLSYRGAGWIFTPLHSFVGSEGNGPVGVTIGPDGNLYGATMAGGGGQCNGEYGCGTVFKLTPPAAICRVSFCPWTATILYRFTGGSDGGTPLAGVVFDQAGNLYGTTYQGGNFERQCTGGCGVVYELSPSHGSWTQSVIHSFAGGDDGAYPYSGLIFDSAGTLYGTTSFGGGPTKTGTVFEMTPSGSGWTKTTLYNFQSAPDGTRPLGGLILDGSGNLYGTTFTGGTFNLGTVFSLSLVNGGWVETLLYSFTGTYGDELPQAGLFLDASGNLYGTTPGGGDGPPNGNVFQLTPSNGSWIYASLHAFTRGSDGANPFSNVVMDANGNLYGTASTGGSTPNCTSGEGTCGVVWEISP